MTATISDLWQAFQRFQASALALDATDYYQLGLWADGEGEIQNNEWVVVTQWDTMQEGIDKLNELAELNEEAAKHG